MRKNGKLNTTYMVEMALLIAIILIMAFTPIGYIKTFGLEITLIVVPVAVGAVVLGPTAGAILGGVFGLTSFIQCFGMSAFGAMLLSINPAGTFVVCFVTRLVMGWLTGLIAQGLKKVKALKGNKEQKKKEEEKSHKEDYEIIYNETQENDGEDL